MLGEGGGGGGGTPQTKREANPEGEREKRIRSEGKRVAGKPLTKRKELGDGMRGCTTACGSS